MTMYDPNGAVVCPAAALARLSGHWAASGWMAVGGQGVGKAGRDKAAISLYLV